MPLQLHSSRTPWSSGKAGLEPSGSQHCGGAAPAAGASCEAAVALATRTQAEVSTALWFPVQKKERKINTRGFSLKKINN